MKAVEARTGSVPLYKTEGAFSRSLFDILEVK